MPPIAINGRFLSRPLTGVDRVAEEIVRALDQLSEGDAVDAVLLVPPGATRRLSLDRIPTQEVGRFEGHLWEQIDLPRAASGRWLLNLCNTGPLAHRKALVTIHDAQVYLSPESYSRPFRVLYKGLLPLLARRSSLVTTVSAFSRGELEKHGVCPAGKAVVIPNGADHIDRIQPAPAILDRHGLEANRYFLALGSLSPHKNLRTALSAHALTGGMRHKLVIAGGANPKVFAATDLPRSANTIFTGRVSDEELKALYENATALVFPSFFEGFGLPPLEAMRCGCPVIASTAAAVAEACDDAALYADPKVPGDWARQMDRIAADDGLRRQLAESGRRHSATFTWDVAARRMTALVALAAST